MDDADQRPGAIFAILGRAAARPTGQQRDQTGFEATEKPEKTAQRQQDDHDPRAMFVQPFLDVWPGQRVEQVFQMIFRAARFGATLFGFFPGRDLLGLDSDQFRMQLVKLAAVLADFRLGLAQSRPGFGELLTQRGELGGLGPGEERFVKLRFQAGHGRFDVGHSLLRRLQQRAFVRDVAIEIHGSLGRRLSSHLSLVCDDVLLLGFLRGGRQRFVFGLRREDRRQRIQTRFGRQSRNRYRRQTW